MTAPAFTVLIPARLASTRLPNKPLADIAGLPMVVHVARRARASGATRVVVATDSEPVLHACNSHGIDALMTDADHVSGSDRLAQACTLLGLDDEDVVVNLQGDEPLMPPNLLAAVAGLLERRTDCAMATAAHPIDAAEDFSNPNVVKVVLDARDTAMYFSRAPIPWWRDGMAAATPAPIGALEHAAPLRHIGLYAYRAGFLRRFPLLQPAPCELCESLEQLRVLWHGERIAVHVTPASPGTGVDTPQDLARVRAWYAENAAN